MIETLLNKYRANSFIYLCYFDEFKLLWDDPLKREIIKNYAKEFLEENKHEQFIINSLTLFYTFSATTKERREIRENFLDWFIEREIFF